MNRVEIIGRLGSDVELKYTTSGIAVSKVSVAVSGRKNAQGEKTTDWVRVVLWKQSAEFAANYLGKGRLVEVTGRLSARSWVDQAGVKHYTTEVVADHIAALDYKPNTDAATEEGFDSDGSDGSFLDPYTDD